MFYKKCFYRCSLRNVMFMSIVSFFSLSSFAFALEEITVAYFLKWPTPSQYGQAHSSYDKALGIKIHWRPFDTGKAMAVAMATGDAHIAFSQGLVPFVTATSSGQDLQMVDIAVKYSENDNCVVHSNLKITKDNVQQLKGARVGVPLGTAAHFGFLKQMEHFDIDVSSMHIQDMVPADGAKAFALGNLDVVCGWGGELEKMKTYGNVLLDGAEKDALGISVVDITSVTAQFALKHPNIVKAFVQETARLNALYIDNKEQMIYHIAEQATMNAQETRKVLEGFSFLNVQEQLSEHWFGGGMQSLLKETADFLVKQGSIPQTRRSYDDTVNASFLQAVTIP